MATYDNLLFAWVNVEQLPEFQCLKLLLDNLQTMLRFNGYVE